MKFNVYKDGVLINKIIAKENFVKNYCNFNGFTYEEIPEPQTEKKEILSKLDYIESQITYTAMMTDTLLEV